ncbi:MAG: hypothetical protein L0Z07_08390 [Planctomycetes bacterium]|nr:hypothetical protein [Planctomycetota bacterium]
MTSEMNRRKFVQHSVLASAGAAMAVSAAVKPTTARADDPPPLASTPTVAADMPRGKIGDMEISRLLLGGNLLTHFTHSRDLKYVYSLAKHYNTENKILETLAVAEEHGINTVVVHNVPSIIALLQKHRQRGGKLQWITCTSHALAGGDLAKFAGEVETLVDAGTDALYISGVEADCMCGFKNGISAVNSAERSDKPKLDVLAQALDLAKAHGLPTGLGAHRLGAIQDCEKAGLEIDFYLKTFHHLNYPTADLKYDSSFCPDPAEEVVKFMQTVKKPWIAFKVMAAGAIPPQSAFEYAFAGGADFVLAGMFDFEIAEDARIVREVFPTVQRQRPLQA